jgi:hypothetical protein
MVSGVNVSTCHWESRKGFIWDQLRFSHAYPHPVYTRLFFFNKIKARRYYRYFRAFANFCRQF